VLYWICLFFSAYQEGTLSLCLCDTNAQEDVHINDTLVAEEYAFCPKLDSPEAQSPNGQVYKYQLIYSGISLMNNWPASDNNCPLRMGSRATCYL